MFRHPQTHHLDTVKIQQHVASIEFLAELLAYSTKSPQKDVYASLSLQAINKYVEAAVQAIQQLEYYRDYDYLNNQTKRAENVLNSVDMFKRLYKVHLKNSEHQIAARALKNELRDYSTSVAGLMAAINDDRKDEIIAGLNQQYEDALARQADEELNHDFDLLSYEVKADRLAAYVASQDETVSECDSSTSEDEAEESYGYFKLSSDSEEEGMSGSFDFSMQETEPLLVTEYDTDVSESSAVSENEVSENSELSDTEELAPPTPKLPRRLSFVSNWSDYSSSETEEESLSASADDSAEESEEFSLEDLFSSPTMKR